MQVLFLRTIYLAHFLKKDLFSRAWWRTPLIPALGRQRQVDFWVPDQPGLQSDQTARATQRNPVLEKKKDLCMYVCVCYVCEYTIAVQMVVSFHVVVGNWILGPLLQSAPLTQTCSLRPKDLFIIIYKYTVAVFRHTRRGRQISLRVVVSHHVVAGIWTQDLWKSSQCS